MLTLVIAAAVAASVPSQSGAQASGEALRLGRELAKAGTLAHLLPIMATAQTAELVSEIPGIDAKDTAALRATAQRVFLAGQERLMSAEAQSYARLLSIADMRRVAGFERSAAGRAYRVAGPKVIAQTMQAVGSMDFKADVRAAYCKESGKLCAKK